MHINGFCTHREHSLTSTTQKKLWNDAIEIPAPTPPFAPNQSGGSAVALPRLLTSLPLPALISTGGKQTRAAAWTALLAPGFRRDHRNGNTTATALRRVSSAPTRWSGARRTGACGRGVPRAPWRRASRLFLLSASPPFARRAFSPVRGLLPWSFLFVLSAIAYLRTRGVLPCAAGYRLLERGLSIRLAAH